jgi:SAM-dependent methyltransferase
MNLFERLHEAYFYGRRVRRLRDQLARLIPSHARVLDVSSGDGLLARRIQEQRPDIELRAIDVLVRPHTHVPIEAFDGQTIPFEDESFDLVMFVDVLHHAEDPLPLLREAVRVSRQYVLIKDHLLEGALAGPTLRFMDRVGNLRYGVAVPYRYWKRETWLETFGRLDLEITAWSSRLGLYPWPTTYALDRSLHFIALLTRARPPAPSKTPPELPAQLPTPPA